MGGGEHWAGDLRNSIICHCSVGGCAGSGRRCLYPGSCNLIICDGRSWGRAWCLLNQRHNREGKHSDKTQQLDFD